MIDTYMNRADAATGYRPTPTKPVDRDDPCYWNGALYDSVINRMVAEAKYNLRVDIARIHHHHAREVWRGFSAARARIGGAA